MRPQHNNKRGRGRNRRHGGNLGGGGGGGGGSPNNRVLDSNGPDVKLRGTAQTIAEKYMQLARDAQSSGDTVMAESYYQHADHYYRVWLAAQPPGQPVQFSRRMAEDDMADDDSDGGEGEDDTTQDGENAEGADTVASGDTSSEDGDANGEQQTRPNRAFRDNRDDRGDRNTNTGNGRERFRPRWPRRNDRDNRDNGGAAPVSEAQAEMPERVERQEQPERTERPDRAERAERFPRRERVQADAPIEAVDDKGDWEAPSFLKRPVPSVASSDDVEVEGPAVEPRKPRGRRPRYGEDLPPVVATPPEE